MKYLLLGIGFVVIFIFVLLMNNIIECLDNNHQILVSILLKESAIEKQLKKNHDTIIQMSIEDAIKAMNKIHPYYIVEDDCK